MAPSRDDDTPEPPTTDHTDESAPRDGELDSAKSESPDGDRQRKGRASKKGSEPSVDPRLQARRRLVAKETGRRRLWIAGSLAMVATIAVSVIGIAKSALFDVETVTVVGADESDPGQIIRSSAIKLGQPLVDVDTAAAAASVEAVPWVLSAQVRRGWRGTVVIEVSERVPVLAIPTGARFVLVDAAGRQLEIVDTQPTEMLPISGVEASGVPGDPIPEAAHGVLPVLAALPAPLQPEVVGFSIERDEVYAQLAVGGQARLGDDRELDEKLAALDTVLLRVDLRCIDVIDVRVPRSPTVSRKTLLFDPKEPNEPPGGC